MNCNCFFPTKPCTKLDIRDTEPSGPFLVLSSKGDYSTHPLSKWPDISWCLKSSKNTYCSSQPADQVFSITACLCFDLSTCVFRVWWASSALRGCSWVNRSGREESLVLCVRNPPSCLTSSSLYFSSSSGSSEWDAPLVSAIFCLDRMSSV